METLSSPHHPLAKKWKSLLEDSKKRRQLGSFILEGRKLAEEALSSGLGVVEAVVTPEFARKPQNRALIQLLRERKIPEHYVEEGLLEKVTDTVTPQGVLAVLRMPQAEEASAWLRETHGLSIAAYGLQDPGNLGTLLRSAWAAGAEGVLLGDGCADPWSPKSIRAGMGAQLHLPVFSGVDLKKALPTMKRQGIKLVAAVPQARLNYLDSDFGLKTCFLMGSEGQGLPGEMAALCDQEVRLDYPGPAESLNVSIAASILLFDTLRRKSHV